MDNICYALHEMEHLTERPAELKQEIFKLLFDSAELSEFTADERAKYQLDMTTERDIHNQIVYARDKGLEECLEQGRAEGRAEGLAEGAREQTLQSAKRLMELGVATDIIISSTGLPVEEVEALRKGE